MEGFYTNLKYFRNMRPAKKPKSYFSERLIELRKAHDLTQEQFADALGVSLGTVSYYEAKASNPQANSLQTLADFFKVTADYFLEHDAPRKTKPGPLSKLEQKVEEVKNLSPAKQKLAYEMLDMLVKGAESSQLAG